MKPLLPGISNIVEERPIGSVDAVVPLERIRVRCINVTLTREQKCGGEVVEEPVTRGHLSDSAFRSVDSVQYRSEQQSDVFSWPTSLSFVNPNKENVQTSKMFLKLVTLLVLPLLLLLNESSAQCLIGNDSPMSMPPGSKKSVVDSRFNFALDTLKQMVQIESHDNIFYSPYSIHQALTLAYFGARGSTESSLKKALHIPNNLSKIEMQRYYAFENSMKKATRSRNASNYEYATANRLWISDTRKVRDCMLDLFGSQLEKVDFRTNPSAIREQMNEWVSNMTKGHIRDLFSADSITADTDLVLANAVYFKGQWQSRFDPANSMKDLFYTSRSQHSTATFMRQKGNFNHYISEALGAHVLELPYKGNEISMFVLLPPFVGDSKQVGERDSVRQLIENISSESKSMELHELLDSNVLPQDVEIILPKFEIEKDLPLPTLLHALGATELVTPDMADLRGFVEDGEKPLHLGDAVHRARIEVSEEGTTAAAATALLSFRSGRPLQPAVFKANHPFVYFIYEKATRTILFCGIYRSPNPQQNTMEKSA